MRTCAGCGRRASKVELQRFVARAGTLTADRSGHAAGRGVYTCRERACFDKALRRRAFGRRLRVAIDVPAGLQGVYEGV